MNRALCLLLALSLFACEKRTSDVRQLEDEAVALAKYTQPRIEQVKKRIIADLERLATYQTGDGLDATRALMEDAKGRWVALNGIAGVGPEGKSALEKQAEAAAKADQSEDLRKLLEDSRTKLDEGFLVISEDLASVEYWLSQHVAHAAGK